MKRFAAISVLLLAASGAGCGTIVDTVGVHMDGPRVYGGVALHVERWTLPEKAYWWPLWVIFTVVDIPLCAVVDTLFLPYTIPRNYNHPHSEESPAK